MRQFGDLVTPMEPSTRTHSKGDTSDRQIPATNPKAINLGYLARELVQCTLPHRDPKTDTYIRKDGNYRLMIESGTNIRTGEKFGLPYGTLPRLLMLFVNTEAVRKQGKDDDLVISFGHTMNEFLRNVGCDPATGGGKRGDAVRLRMQHTRLFNARFTFARIEGDSVFGSEGRKALEITQEIRTFWDYRNPDQGTLWESYIVLTKEFQQALISNPVPFDFEHLRELKRSPLAIDLYCWLTYRLFRANNDGFTVPFKALKEQFGTGYSRMDNFKAALDEALEMVHVVFPAIQYEFTPSGLAVDPLSRRELPVSEEQKVPAFLPSDLSVVTQRKVYDEMQLLIMPADLKRINRLVLDRGLDLDPMLLRWRSWCKEGNIRVTNAAAHFTDFVKRHDPHRS